MAGCIVATMVVAGLGPCALPGRVSAMAKHDCCDPDQVEANRTADAAAPVLTAGPADCCLVSPGAQPPATMPGVSCVTALRVDAVGAIEPTRLTAPTFSARITTGDLRARSAPRPPLVSVLLI